MSNNKVVIYGLEAMPVVAPSAVCQLIHGLCRPGKPVPLRDCPPGPFLFNGEIGIKGELPGDDGGIEALGASGEFFWGGADTMAQREAVLVRPVVAPQDASTRPKPDDEVAKIRIESKDKASLEKIAAKEGRTFAGQCRTALREWVAAHTNR